MVGQPRNSRMAQSLVRDSRRRDRHRFPPRFGALRPRGPKPSIHDCWHFKVPRTVTELHARLDDKNEASSRHRGGRLPSLDIHTPRESIPRGITSPALTCQGGYAPSRHLTLSVVVFGKPYGGADATPRVLRFRHLWRTRHAKQLTVVASDSSVVYPFLALLPASMFGGNS